MVLKGNPSPVVAAGLRAEERKLNLQITDRARSPGQYRAPHEDRSVAAAELSFHLHLDIAQQDQRQDRRARRLYYVSAPSSTRWRGAVLAR